MQGYLDGWDYGRLRADARTRTAGPMTSEVRPSSQLLQPPLLAGA
jgi:hypothetical protein